MKRSIVYNLVLLLSYSLQVETFSLEAKTKSRPKVPEDDANDGFGLHSDRRKILVKSLGILTAAGTLTVNSNTAHAVEFGNNGPNKARLGGLANKIRNICNNMVSIKNLSLLLILMIKVLGLIDFLTCAWTKKSVG